MSHYVPGRSDMENAISFSFFACSYHVTFSRMRSFHLVCDANCDSTTKCGGSLASGRSKQISVIKKST